MLFAFSLSFTSVKGSMILDSSIEFLIPRFELSYKSSFKILFIVLAN